MVSSRNKEITLAIKTAFTERFGLQHPIMLAPMDKVPGALAAAVSAAGGMGIIGGGYGDADWVEQAFQEAGNKSVGVSYVRGAQIAISRCETRAGSQSRRINGVLGDAEELVAMAKDAACQPFGKFSVCLRRNRR